MKIPVTRLVILSAAIGVTLGGVAGCVDWFQPKVESPLTHKLVGADQLQADYSAKERQAAVDDARDAAEASRKAEEASAEAKAALIKLGAGNESAAADIQLAAIKAGNKAAADYAAASAQRHADLDTLAQQTQTALSSIETQAKANAALWAVAKPFASMIPGGAQGASAIDVLLGVGTLATGGYALKKRSDLKGEQADHASTKADLASEQSEHADTKAELVATQGAASRVVDSIDALALKEPAVKQALVDHKTLLDQWQGEAGKDLVDFLQKGKTPSLTN